MPHPTTSRHRLRPSASAILPFVASVVAIMPVDVAFADNPIIQTNYTADPAPLVYEDTVYLYTSHDEDELVNDFFTMNDWRCYSSVDMVNWTDHGSPLDYMEFSWAGGDAWAGQVIHRDGRFFYYVPITSSALNRHVIGVAVADDPLGPFEDPIGEPLIAVGGADIDPTVFIDSDGEAYLYWGNPNLLYVRLNPDMISFSGTPQSVPMSTQSFGIRTDNPDRPTLYEEGPWFYRRNDLYYVVFAADCCSSPEDIDYATSNGPTGPWQYRGRIMDSAGSASFTNHPGVIDFRGHSYLFYHNGALPGGGGFHRSVALEEFTYRPDGSFPTIPMTEEGPAPLQTLDPFRRTEAETMAFSVGLDTEACSEGGMNVTGIDDGDWIKVKNVDFGSGITTFDARVSSPSGGGAIEVHLDAPDGLLVGTCVVPSTGGTQTWQTQPCPMTGASGTRDLFFRFVGGGFGFNWWQFGGPGETDDPSDVGDSGGGTGGDVGGGASGTSAGATGASGGTTGTYDSDGGQGLPTGPMAGDDGSSSDRGPSDSAPPGTVERTGQGCSCRSGARGASPSLLLFIGCLPWVRRSRCRRRRRRSRPGCRHFP